MILEVPSNDTEQPELELEKSPEVIEPPQPDIDVSSLNAKNDDEEEMDLT